MKLARALGYLNHKYNLHVLYQVTRYSVVELNEDHSITSLGPQLRSVEKNNWCGEYSQGVSRRAFQTMYTYSDLIESQVEGDTKPTCVE